MGSSCAGFHVAGGFFENFEANGDLDLHSESRVGRLANGHKACFQIDSYIEHTAIISNRLLVAY